MLSKRSAINEGGTYLSGSVFIGTGVFEVLRLYHLLVGLAAADSTSCTPGCCLFDFLNVPFLNTLIRFFLIGVTCGSGSGKPASTSPPSMMVKRLSLNATLLAREPRRLWDGVLAGDCDLVLGMAWTELLDIGFDNLFKGRIGASLDWPFPMVKEYQALPRK
jgi:hypothetical protein